MAQTNKIINTPGPQKVSGIKGIISVVSIVYIHTTLVFPTLVYLSIQLLNGIWLGEATNAFNLPLLCLADLASIALFVQLRLRLSPIRDVLFF